MTPPLQSRHLIPNAVMCAQKIPKCPGFRGVLINEVRVLINEVVS